MYDSSIDMWSLGCTAIELFIKTPIFPGKYDYDQLLKILEFCGLPPNDLIHFSIHRDRFFFFNPEQQRYNFKSFTQFLMTQVPPEHHQNVEEPQRYHAFLNFMKLLEHKYIQKLQQEHFDVWGNSQEQP
jgi:dual specificity protein kinase YAK1